MAYHHGRLVLYEQNDWWDNQSFASPLWYCKRTMDYGSDSLWGLVGEALRCDRADSMGFFLNNYENYWWKESPNYTRRILGKQNNQALKEQD